MNTIHKKFFITHGFKEVLASDLKEFIQESEYVKNMNLTAYKANPAELLGKTKSKNAVISIAVEGSTEQFVILTAKRKKWLFQVPLSEMQNILTKIYDNGLHDILFTLPGDIRFELSYRIV